VDDEYRTPPSDAADDLDWVLFQQQGVLSQRQALRLLSAKTIRHRITSGRWQRAHRGVLVTHTGQLTVEQRHWVAVLAVGAGKQAYLGGLSALQTYGVRLTSEAIHILVPHAQRDLVPPAAVRVHRTRHLPAEDLHGVGLPPRTMPARSVVDSAAWARSADEARLIIAVAIQRHIVSCDEIIAVLARLPRARRRVLIATTALDADGGAHSLAELDFLALCRKVVCPNPPARWSGRMPPGGGGSSTRTSPRGVSTSRSTAGTTWTPSSGGLTCAGRTIFG
jgi:hypothetical protein